MVYRQSRGSLEVAAGARALPERDASTSLKTHGIVIFINLSPKVVVFTCLKLCLSFINVKSLICINFLQGDRLAFCRI
jgi:hypothetical protein